MMEYLSKIRTPEQIAKKMLKEERTIMDLQLAIKKEQTQIHMKSLIDNY